MPKLAWSYSQLNDFESCPKKFQSKYILKEWPKEDDSPHLVKGRRIHEAMEKLVERVQECLGGGFDRAIYGEVHHMIPLIQKLVSSGGRIETEVQQSLTEQLHPTGWFDKNTWVRGIFDLIIWFDDHALVIDWKTGKPWPDNGQLALFAAFAMAMESDIKYVDTAYVYIDHKGKAEKKRYTREDFDALWQDFGDRSELIQIANESGNWEVKPSKMACKYCKANCEHAESR